jgi:hypothetical protein
MRLIISQNPDWEIVELAKLFDVLKRVLDGCADDGWGEIVGEDVGLLVDEGRTDNVGWDEGCEDNDGRYEGDNDGVLVGCDEGRSEGLNDG